MIISPLLTCGGPYRVHPLGDNLIQTAGADCDGPHSVAPSPSNRFVSRSDAAAWADAGPDEANLFDPDRRSRRRRTGALAGIPRHRGAAQMLASEGVFAM